MKSYRLLVLVALLVAACGGGTTTASTTGDDSGSATTAASVGTTAAPDDEEVGSISDMPAECQEAFVAFLHAIEPVVEGFDFENASVDDMEAISVELEGVSDEFSTEAETLNCPDLDPSTDAFAEMAEFAENEAPGTVGYMRWLQTFVAGTGGGASASGDCETDISAMQTIVDETGTMGNMNLTDLTAMGELMASIQTSCSLERADEFFQKEDVQAFLNSEG